MSRNNVVSFVVASLLLAFLIIYFGVSSQQITTSKPQQDFPDSICVFRFDVEISTYKSVYSTKESESVYSLMNSIKMTLLDKYYNPLSPSLFKIALYKQGALTDEIFLYDNGLIRTKTKPLAVKLVNYDKVLEWFVVHNITIFGK